MNKSQIENVKMELLPNSTTEDGLTSVIPSIAKPHVGSSFSVKYPRTFHFEFSQGQTNDDKIQYDLSNFEGKEIVITEKMDGENTTMTNEKYYARSLDSNNHPSRNYVKGIWGPC